MGHYCTPAALCAAEPERFAQAELIAIILLQQATILQQHVRSEQLQARPLCQAHPRRDLPYAVDAERSAFAYRLQRLFLRAQRLRKRRGRLSPLRFAQQVARIEQACDEWLAAPLAGAQARRLLKRRPSGAKTLYGRAGNAPR